jgi:hypothetical protein
LRTSSARSFVSIEFESTSSVCRNILFLIGPNCWVSHFASLLLVSHSRLAVRGDLLRGSIGLTIACALLFYLLRPNVRATFHSADETP